MMTAAASRKQALFIASFILLIIGTLVIGAGLGQASLSYNRLLPTLFGYGTFKEEFVLFSVRLPRMLITLLAGMALALSGVILQGVTRNDLADPGMMGINSGAGVAVAVFFMLAPIDAASFAIVLPAVAFLGAVLTAGLLYALARTKHSGLEPGRMVLMGVGLSLALSGLMIIMISAAEREKVEFVAKWLAGSVWGADWPYIAAIAPWLVLLVPYALYKARVLNLLSLNEPTAAGVGVSLEKERIVLLLTAVALAAAAVSVTGGIAFVGLMAPHIARGLIGPRHQYLIPSALLVGGFLLLAADTIGRNVADPSGLPAGVVVALIGAPYFIYLLSKR
ncbi:iron ABC transporter permease [Paenibacillus sp. YYML68]|uniref:FecCD family ABC transporter permease n=1 Tax=Paenibacillus sp. YYML68 TaxID=2909250 RepID=UPI0024920B64|nr:iron ABC transporter permease [Paenibacillus sp. YYML68]